MSIRLSPIEARVLAALTEKSVTTPQYYPLTPNAVLAACNQKSARHPVMELNESQVGAALLSLEAASLVSRDEHSGRVAKWRHRFHHQLLVSPSTLAPLVSLMLRGPQTLAELRSTAEILGGSSDLAQLASALDDLADRAQPLVATLPKAPGQSAARWTHLLCGPVDSAIPAARSASSAGADLHARVAELEQQLLEMRQRLDAAGL